ncbi:MAG: serine/threonine-protein kinase [Ectothiorhodospiraceae bacterium]|jgi:serine/threonine-protein kinase PpkA
MDYAKELAIEIPGYRVQQELGRGAMATAYLAIQESLEREIALKILAGSLVADRSFCARFLREGRIIAQLSHPHVVTIHDIGVHGTVYYMAEEYLSGGTLRERIRRGIPVERALEILCHIAAALGYAHQRGFVHRDVKPGNILFRSDGTVVLTDFGIARASAGATHITTTGWTVGTPDYMSPEQAMGKPVDARSDLYSLGIVLYEMLTGSRPYCADDPFATALMHVRNPIPRLPATHAGLQALVDRLLAKAPDERFASADELVDAVKNPGPTAVLSTAAPADATRAMAGLDSVPVSPPRRRARALPFAAAALIPVLGAGVYVYMYRPAGPSGTTVPVEEGAPSADADAVDVRPAVRKEITQLLTIADAHRDVGRLTNPPGSNAAEVYRRVLTLDPSNRAAKTGLQTIADTFEERARASLRKGQLNTSLQQANAGLEVVPDHQGLLGLRDRIRQQPKPKEQILQLLAVAEAHRGLDRLTEPPGSNAADVYRHILELDPFNAPARQGLASIADIYLKRARERAGDGESEEAMKAVEAGLAVVPDYQGLLDLRKQIAGRVPGGTRP